MGQEGFMPRILAVLVLVAVATGCGASARPVTDLKIEITPERQERGKYLAHNVLGCISCHTKRDWKRFAGPPAGPFGGGGVCLTEEMGFPGMVCSSNITSDVNAGLGSWTDDQILRAVREGVDNEGEALFPSMPYGAYRYLSDEDALAVVAYIRTLRPVDNPVDARDLDFPVGLFIGFTPEPLDGPVAAPDASDSVAYGEYLTRVAGCRSCHTPTTGTGASIESRTFAGGREFTDPYGKKVTSSNLTPHDTGLLRYTKESFLTRFSIYQDVEETAQPLYGDANTYMPWFDFANMTPEDLGAIFDYLMTLEPLDPADVLETE
jgi:mono/diheme cytochrome c family protein